MKLWWRLAEMPGHVWLEEEAEEVAADNGSLLLLPPVMVSEDISRFRYTNLTGHPSGSLLLLNPSVMFLAGFAQYLL